MKILFIKFLEKRYKIENHCIIICPNKDTTGKKLWSGENDEVSLGNRDVWANIKGKKNEG